MGYDISSETMNQVIRKLKNEYRIYAPKRFEKRGFKPGTDLIRYAEIDKAEEIVYDVKSDFSPKEVFYPISQTMLYFTGDQCMESEADDKGIIIFARPCDINGIRRLDKIFLENGGGEDSYYKRLREKLKIFMIECCTGWESCFCVSTDSNKTDDYSVAVRFGDDRLTVRVKDEAFQVYFNEEKTCDFTPAFVIENTTKVTLPDIDGVEMLKKIYGHPVWKEYNDKCISCGACNTVCITCSCFDTIDIIYSETSRDGERRRVWSSCMFEDFTTMAGGHNVRRTAGERLRFRTLHKVYDYKARFGEKDMCVGCGRCDSRCPAEISFSGIMNRLSESIKGGTGE